MTSRCFTSASRGLLDELAIARLHGRQARLLKTLARTRLLILDVGLWSSSPLTSAVI
jgi:hypothetical protein